MKISHIVTIENWELRDIVSRMMKLGMDYTRVVIDSVVPHYSQDTGVLDVKVEYHLQDETKTNQPL